MDPAIIATLAPLLTAVAPLVVAPVASLAANAAEKLPVIPYQGQTKAGIVLALLLASLGVRVVLASATGTLGSLDWQAELRLVVDAVVATLAAAGGYSLTKSDKPTV